MANDGMGGTNGEIPVSYGPIRPNDPTDTVAVRNASMSTPVKKTNDIGHTVNPSDVGGNR